MPSPKNMDPMQLRFGSYPVVVASSAEMAKAILETHDIIFTGRPKTAAGKYISYNHSDILWSSYGPYWRQARKLCLTELFSAKRLESYKLLRREEVNFFLKLLKKSSSSPITLKDYLFSLSLNVISRMALGKKYTEGTGENEIVTAKEFKEMLDELFLLKGVLNTGDSRLNFLDLQGYIKRMKGLSKKFDRFLEHVLDEHNARRNGEKGSVAKDMMDVLLELAEDPNHDVKLERHGVKALSLNMIVPGTESSAVTIEWAIFEMLKKSKIFTKATEELDRVIGRERWVEEKYVVNLSYIDSIVKETKRLHPVAPILAHHISREDCQIANYDIPKGTRALVSVWAIRRDPNLWENPNEFCLERFIGRTIDVKGHDFELLPFGFGRRICPGYPLEAGNKTKEELNMEEIFGLTTLKSIHLRLWQNQGSHFICTDLHEFYTLFRH